MPATNDKAVLIERCEAVMAITRRVGQSSEIVQAVNIHLANSMRAGAATHQLSRTQLGSAYYASSSHG